MEAEVCKFAPDSWEVLSVADVCRRVTSGGTPSRKRPEFYQNGVWPWVKTQELLDGWIDKTEEQITEDAVAESSAKVLPAETILMAMYGATVGQLGILRRPMTCNQACCAMIVDPKKADFRYLYYQLLNSRTQIRGLATGAAQQNLSGVVIKSLRFPFPPLPEQKAIARILGTLDDKIELNRRMNATLEAMARALFTSWFVDFDPVRRNMEGLACLAGRQGATNPIPEAGGGCFTYAIECQGGSVYIGQTDNLRRRWAQHVDGKGAEWTKTHPPVALVFWEIHDSLEAAVAREKWLKSGSGREWLKKEIAARASVHLPAGEAGAKAALPVGQTGGRQPAGMDPQTAALFPSSFQNSELGEIPVGWETTTLGTVLDVLETGRRPKGGVSTFTSGVPSIGAESIWGIGEFNFDKTKYVPEEFFAKMSSGKVQHLDVLLYKDGGKPGEFRPRVGMFGHNFPFEEFGINEHVFRLRSSTIGQLYLYYSVADPRVLLDFANKGGKAAIPGINQQDVKSAVILQPAPSIVEKFDEIVAPFVDRILRNAKESRTLATLRDTLLPKLLSGEVSLGTD